MRSQHRRFRFAHFGPRPHARPAPARAWSFWSYFGSRTRSTVATEAYYWFAIIVLRTGATNLADLGTHDLKLGYFLCIGSAGRVMVAMLLIDQLRGIKPSGSAGPDGRWHSLPATDASYWITMLAAGTLGTAAGDWVAEANPAWLGLRFAGARRCSSGDVVRRPTGSAK